MKNHLWVGIGIMIATIFVTPAAKAKPIDNLDAECGRTGAINLVVKNPNTGDRFVYWCESHELVPCAGNVCQPGEQIEVEPDCNAFPWDQGCTGDRVPDCPPYHHWDLAKKKCVLACGANQVETYNNGHWTCENLPSGGGGSGTKPPPPGPKTCAEAADKYCQSWFGVGNLKTIAGECYTAVECLKKITVAEAQEMRKPTAQCKLCIDSSCKGLPGASSSFADKYCAASLDIAVGRLADFWKRVKEFEKNPPTKGKPRNECLRDPDLCGRPRHLPPER